MQVTSSVCSLPRRRQRREFVAVVLRKVEQAAAPVGLAPLFLAIKSSGADIIGSYFTFESDLVIFARQLRQLGVNVPWVGSPSMVAAGALKLAGPAIWGTYAVADYAADFEPGGEGIRQALRRRAECAAGEKGVVVFDKHIEFAD